MELLAYNVGILNVVPIIQSVLHMAGLEYDRLPKHTTINEMIVESRSLAQMQVTEALLQAPNCTLHSDGTSKFGHKYMSFQVSTTDETLSMGLQVRNHIPFFCSSTYAKCSYINFRRFHLELLNAPCRHYKT